MNDKERFADMIRKSKRIVAFTGAGISTESGIPDFRSAGGLFDRLSGRHFTGEETLSIGFLETYPQLFFRNYAEYFNFSQARPNAGHRFFARLEQAGKEVAVVTQNIDNLHQSAGSRAVIELHGNGTRWRTFETAEATETTQISIDAPSSAIPKAGWCVRTSCSTARCSTRRRWSARLQQSAPRTCLSSSVPRWRSIRPRISSIISKDRTQSS